MKKITRKIARLAVSLLALSFFIRVDDAPAAWRPGLQCGFHTQGDVMPVPLLWTGTSLDTAAATNYENRCSITDTPVAIDLDGEDNSLWSVGRMWAYWGQIYLPAGEVTFGSSIDDFSILEIDGHEIIHNDTATLSFETAGWHDFSLKLGNTVGAAGPRGGEGLGGGLGFAIKENGATEWSYPADDGTMTRYRYDDGTGFPDILEVSASPFPIGTVSPPYGENRGYTVGERFVCSAPPSITNGGTRADLLGYVVTTNYHVRGEYLKGTSPSFDYLHPGDISYLEWRFAVEHKVDLKASDGGTVSCEGGWYAHGSEMTIEAFPGDGVFIGWAGELPTTASPTNPVLSFIVDRPRSITAMFQTGQFQEKTYIGPSGGAWNEAENWLPSGVPTLSDAVHVPEGKRISAPAILFAGSLTISNSAAVSLAAHTTERNAEVNFLHKGGGLSSFLTASDRGRKADNELIGKSFVVQVAHDVTLLDGAELLVGGHFMTTRPEVLIHGDLVLDGGAKVDLYAGESQLFYERDDFGALVSVDGRVTIGPDAVMTLYNHLGEPVLGQETRSGSAAAVFLSAGEMRIEEGGLLCAHSGLTDMTVARPVWEGSCGDAHYGGSHGGRGGGGGPGMPPYEPGRPANDHLLAPVLPGAFARNFQTIGGGVVRLQAGKVVLNGTIDASATFLAPQWETGGAAGGSIWILCDLFEMGAAGLLAVRGFEGLEYGVHNCGGGGGGRIAVARGLSAEQIHSLATTGAATGLTPVGDLTISHASHVDVSGGPGGYAAEAGEEGTAVFYRAKREGTSSLSVVIDPTDPGAFSSEISPSPGLAFYESGTAISASAPESIFGPGGSRRRTYIGYTLSDGTGAVLSEGAERTCTIPAIDGDLTLVWHYGPAEYLISASSAGNGTVQGGGWYQAGEVVRLVSSPVSGGSFKSWLSDSFQDRQALLVPTFSFEVTGPVSFVAVYSGEGASERTPRCFTGPSGGSWDDPGNWTPAGVPMVDSDAYLPEKAVVDLRRHAIVGSLTVSNGAVLSVFGKKTIQKEALPILKGGSKASIGREALDFEKTDYSAGLGVVDSLELLGSARLTVGGISQFRPSEVAVAGSIRMGGSSLFEIYSGPTNTTSVTTRSGGARILVGGDFLVEDKAIVEVFGHFPVLSVWPEGRIGPATIEAESFHLGPSALLRGVAGSSGWTHLTENVLCKHKDITGAGHGGKGGASGDQSGGAAYDFPYAPLLPGASGRPTCNFGGGAIRLHATSIFLDGTIDVSASCMAYSWEQGGASGGAIWLTAGKWVVGPTAVLLAGGMEARGNGPQQVRGGGAGGRIALGRNLTPTDLDALYATGEGRRGIRRTNLLETPSSFAGTIDVAGGAGFSPGGEAGEPGTAWLLDGTVRGIVLMLR